MPNSIPSSFTSVDKYTPLTSQILKQNQTLKISNFKLFFFFFCFASFCRKYTQNEGIVIHFDKPTDDQPQSPNPIKSNPEKNSVIHNTFTYIYSYIHRNTYLRSDHKIFNRRFENFPAIMYGGGQRRDLKRWRDILQCFVLWEDMIRCGCPARS